MEKLIITHRDNCPDHERWKARFPALQRVIHRADAVLAANDCEVKLEAGGAWQVSSDVRVVHTPGHTAGSLCVLVATAGDTVLFTGDHLAYSATRKVRAVCTRWSAGVALATLHSSPCSHRPDSSVGVGRVQAVQPRQRGRASGVPPPPGRRRRLPLHVDPARPRTHGTHLSGCFPSTLSSRSCVLHMAPPGRRGLGRWRKKTRRCGPRRPLLSVKTLPTACSLSATTSDHSQLFEFSWFDVLCGCEK